MIFPKNVQNKRAPKYTGGRQNKFAPAHATSSYFPICVPAPADFLLICHLSLNTCEELYFSFTPEYKFFFIPFHYFQLQSVPTPGN